MLIKNEFDLIEYYFKQSSFVRDDVIKGIGDDGAILSVPPAHHLIVTTDTLVAGNHFLSSADPAAIAHKALASNLSDLAAMGAKPLWCSLALTLPEINSSWLKAFCAAFHQLARKYQVQLIGGDTTKGPLSLTLTLHGAVPVGQAIRRDTAKVGDLIYVTGTLGESAAGLAEILKTQHCSELDALLSPSAQALMHAHYYATPRVELGQAVRSFVSSGLDISDGLVSDIQHILKASHVSAQIDAACLPLSALLRSQYPDLKKAAQLALTSGEEYELCLTVSPVNQTAFEDACAQTNTLITQIGKIEIGKGLTLTWQGEPCNWSLSGWDHFVSKEK